MKLPRDVSTSDLIKHPQILAYQVSRQKGSHIRLTTYRNGEHHITVPNHHPIRLGTLSFVINEIASHFQKSREEMAHEIFN